MPFSALAARLRPPPSFPTRRSSDLSRPAGQRSRAGPAVRTDRRVYRGAVPDPRALHGRLARVSRRLDARRGIHTDDRQRARARDGRRSEEHTCELQSRGHLVCRFLLLPPASDRPPLSLHDALPISADLLGNGLVQGLLYGPIGAYIAEQFPTRVRYTGASLAYQGASTLGAGFTPMIASALVLVTAGDRKSTRVNSSHVAISYAVFCSCRPPPTAPLFPYTTLFRSQPTCWATVSCRACCTDRSARISRSSSRPACATRAPRSRIKAPRRSARDSHR